MTYSEQLRDPRWQRKRLKTFERDAWRCTQCGDDEHELHVHHLQYINGKLPWEYEDDDLETRCHSCHRNFHRIDKAPGIVVTWAYVMDDQRDAVEAVAWTGNIIERTSNVDDEFECVTSDGKIFSISRGAAALFVKPKNMPVSSVAPWVAQCIREIARMDEEAAST